MNLSPRDRKSLSPYRSPTHTPRKKQSILPTIKTSSGNQKLNFTKSLNDLTPRSKALFFSLCKSPKKKLEESVQKPSDVNPLPMRPSGLNQIITNKSIPDTPKIQKNLNTSNNNEGNQESAIGSFNNLNQAGDSQKLLIMKLNIKEISDVIKLDTVNSGTDSKLATKNYMKDLTKYSTLLMTKINSKSPRSRQALTNLAYDPDNFTYFSFEELYNNNMGRIGNIRKYMEYISSKANEFLNVLNERNRLMRLERDLNKKFINENIISKNFSDSIFHVNTYQLSEDEMEKLYYNYYCSPESRKRLNVSQKKLDSKLLENRSKFITFQKKVDFVANDIKSQVKEQINYYKSWEEILKKKEQIKDNLIEQRKKKATEYIMKVKEKNKEIRKKETVIKHEQEKKTVEFAKSLGEELQNRQKLELQKYKEQGLKDKQLESELLMVQMEKYRNLIEEYREIGSKLQNFEKKNEETLERRMQILEELRQKLKLEDQKSVNRLNRVKTLSDLSEKQLLTEIFSKYNEKHKKTLSNHSDLMKERSISVKNKEKFAIENLKFKTEKLRTSYREKTKGLLVKIEKDDLKSEKSAELRKRKTIAKIEKEIQRETEVRRNYEKEMGKMNDSKKKVLGWHKEINHRKNEKMKESNIIQDDAREKHVEASYFRDSLWTKSV